MKEAKPMMWYAVDSVVPEDIRPDFRRPGGGVTAEYMVRTEAEALAQCIGHLERRKSECDRMISQYQARLEYLNENA